MNALTFISLDLGRFLKTQSILLVVEKYLSESLSFRLFCQAFLFQRIVLLLNVIKIKA